jgi:hypothetical protein
MLPGVLAGFPDWSSVITYSLVPVDVGERGLVRGARLGAAGELAFAQGCESCHERIVEREGPVPVA